MQHLSRWRSFLIPNKGAITQSHSALFHSTNALSEKWKNKFNTDIGGGQQPPKNYIRYEVRQKRSATKKALKSILINGGCSTSKPESFSNISDYTDQLNKKARVKPARQSKRASHKKQKHKHRRESEDSDENPDRFFHATFGKRGFTWAFKSPGMGFDWTENYNWKNSGFSEQNFNGREESIDDSVFLGTYVDRKILGLPTFGPLKIEDVKAAFRLSAFKWHPDKHQGSSKAEAEEKFKLCVNAYNSLCSTLTTD